MKFNPRAFVASGAIVGMVALVTGLVAGGSASASTITSNATADSYVNGAATTTNYGTSSVLIANATGPEFTHIKFVVTGSNGATSAQLKVYSTSSGSTPTQVYKDGNTTWGETTITYANQPAAGTSLGNLTTLVANQYSTLNVPITGDGTYSFVLKTAATAARNMASRETSNPPQLVVTVVPPTSSSPTPTTPTTPTTTPTSSTPLPPTTVTTTATVTQTQPPVTSTVTSTVTQTQPPVTSTVTQTQPPVTVTQPPVTSTVTQTQDPVTVTVTGPASTTVTETPPPVTSTVTQPPVTSTVTQTQPPVTSTVTSTPDPVTSTVTQTQPPVTVTSTVTSTVTASSTTPTTPTTPTSSTTTQPPTSGVLRAAFYYPWFPETWGTTSTGGTFPFTNYHPTLGYYSSDDTTVIAKHIAAMQYAHLDAGISSWWGQGQHSENTRFPQQLAAAAGTGFKWGLYYEKEGFGDPTVAEISGDLSYIQTNYASDPSFLTRNGKPVVMVYADGNDGCAMADRWKQANAAVNNAFFIVLKVFNGYAACASQPDSWHQYGPSTAVQDFKGLSESISPGYFKKGDAAPALARDVAAWNSRVAAMVATGEPIQLITTFNEWGEGTAVESADEWSSASGYGAYVDGLHNNIPDPNGPPTSSTTPSPSTTPSTPSSSTTAPTTPTTPPTTSSTTTTPPVSGNVTKALVIVEENHSQSQMQSGMPFLWSQAQKFGYTTNYAGIRHPSEPNYVAIAGGSLFGVAADDNYATTSPKIGNAPSVFGAALKAGKTAKAYMDTMTSNCPTVSSQGAYVLKHNPWPFFSAEASQCAANDVPAGTPTAGNLFNDITSGTLPNVGMLVPNLNNDAHDGTLAQADSYLQGWMNLIYASPDWKSGHLVVIVTADEDNNTPANIVLTTVIHPSQNGNVVSAALNHYSLNKFLTDLAGAPCMQNGCSASNFATAFGLKF